jgi:hypothetical protein
MVVRDPFSVGMIEQKTFSASFAFSCSAKASASCRFFSWEYEHEMRG